MEQTGNFVGKIIGNSTKLRTEHSTVGGNVTVLASYGAGLVVTADRKWTCDISDPAKLAQVGDVWIHVTHIGTIDVVDGWMAVNYHGTPIVTLTTDIPDVVEPPITPPYDSIVVNSITLDLNAAHEIVATWVNGSEFRPYPPAEDVPVG